MILFQALEIAEKYKGLLVPWCEPNYCEVAGSVRRQRPECGDVEIVCVPKTVHLIPFAETVRQWWKVKGEPTGRYTKRRLYEGIDLDLFITNKKDFARQLVVRTGSANYSAKVIAMAWVKKGWRGTEDGLRLEKECVPIKAKGALITKAYGGKEKIIKWICNVPRPQLPPEWNSEREFFDWLGVRYVPPWERNL